MPRARDHQHHNLPWQRTRLIGREEELARVREMLLWADGRLVTLTGMGGCGKSRLALAVAISLADRFSDGICLVELGSLDDPRLVPQAAATALDVHEQPTEHVLATVVANLRSRQLLVVLDNCEHLLEACAELVDAVRASCPSVRVLVTSREPVGIDGEITRHVPPLAVPGCGPLQVLDEFARCAAAQLFVERAQAVKPGFALTSHNAPSVAQICRHVDGLPLGIELAAARLRTLGVDQILERLEASMPLLLAGSRTASEAQHTLAAALEWSHALLTRQEQVLFRRLAVFAGGCTLEALERVSADDKLAGVKVPKLVNRLVDKSLVIVEEHPRPARYRMLEPVRQYALERLRVSGELELIQRHHARYFASVAAECDIVVGPRRQVVYDVLKREQHNLRLALRWCLEHGETQPGSVSLRRIGTSG